MDFISNGRKFNILKVINTVKAGLIWLQSRIQPNQFLILGSVLVGITAGIAAVILKMFAHYVHVVITYPYHTALGKYFYLCLPITGILLTIFMIRRLLKGKLNKGTTHILRTIRKKVAVLPKSETYAHILTSGITVGFGGSAGLESPIVATGAAIGTNFSRSYKLPYEDRLILLACGASAGIAGAFNAPIAGVLFALEVLLSGATISAFIPLIISAAAGALCSIIILQENVLLSFKLQEPFNYSNTPFYILLGLIAGVLSVGYKRWFLKIEKFLHHRMPHVYKRAIIGGTVLTILIFCFPPLLGEGYGSIKSLEGNNEKMLFTTGIFEGVNNSWLILFLVSLTMFFKVIAASLTINSGGNGGNFAPSLFVGAFLGYTFSKFLNLLNLTHLPISNFTLVAMAGILSGVFHAPLTAIFLIAEITGGYGLMIPLMIVSAISYVTSRHFEPYTIEEQKL